MADGYRLVHGNGTASCYHLCRYGGTHNRLYGGNSLHCGIDYRTRPC